MTALPAKVGGEELGQDRVLLGLVTFMLLMLGLGVLAVAIAITAWPGRKPAHSTPVKAAAAELMPTVSIGASQRHR